MAFPDGTYDMMDYSRFGNKMAGYQTLTDTMAEVLADGFFDRESLPEGFERFWEIATAQIKDQARKGMLRGAGLAIRIEALDGVVTDVLYVDVDGSVKPRGGRFRHIS